ncbi:MAG: cytosolic protein [Chlorobi bacterium]|nr:cytosolic protein [Chlorobiota bacterium]
MSNIKELKKYTTDYLKTYEKRRLNLIEDLTLSKLLKLKSPYFFILTNFLTADQIVRSITDAFLSSNEETIFGDWLEGLAIFINQQVYGGWKSGIPNIDLEFDKDNVRYIVNIKSGPNWGNSSQIAKMKADFSTAKRTIRTSNSQLMVVAVNGCCYGKENNPDKGEYFKYCGQQFWEFISGNSDLYTEIIEPLGHKAKERNEEFVDAYSRMINQFTNQFFTDFCKDNGEIDWGKLVEFNSGGITN